MQYIIKRADRDGGGYVTESGAGKSYTKNILQARRYSSKEIAEANQCPENEVVLTASYGQ